MLNPNIGVFEDFLNTHLDTVVINTHNYSVGAPLPIVMQPRVQKVARCISFQIRRMCRESLRQQRLSRSGHYASVSLHHENYSLLIYVY